MNKELLLSIALTTAIASTSLVAMEDRQANPKETPLFNQPYCLKLLLINAPLYINSHQILKAIQSCLHATQKLISLVTSPPEQTIVHIPAFSDRNVATTDFEINIESDCCLERAIKNIQLLQETIDIKITTSPDNEFDPFLEENNLPREINMLIA